MLFKWFSRLLHTLVFLVLVYIFSAIFAPILVEATPITNVFINEIHYDNNGGDIDEYVEIAGEANIDLSGWSLWLYNGNSGEAYNSFGFDNWSFIDTTTQMGFHSVKTTGIQNGSPDGLVLFDGANIVQFLSYEGSFTATAGIAKDMLSTDIGVSEDSNTPLNFSLQLTGNGTRYSDFTWSNPQGSSFGAMNVGQEFITAETNIISVSEPSSWVMFISFLLSVVTISQKRNAGVS